VPEEKTDPDVEAVRATPPRPRVPADGKAPALDRALLAFVRGLGDRPDGPGREGLAQSLFSRLEDPLFRDVSEGLHRRAAPAGSIVLNEGDPGDSVFIIASGSVRVLVVGGHGRRLEIRRLDAVDFFGEVAALSGSPRSATVVAFADCELLEVDRWALEKLVEARPGARSVLEEARSLRAQSAEEAAVRSLPEEASPERAATVLAAHFGAASWSPRVRLHFAKLMLDAGQESDGLAVIASVAEEMAGSGHAETGIAILKKVDQIRKRDAGAAVPRVSRAASEAAFRVWVGSLAQGTDALPRAAAPPAEEEEADGDRHR
jgi:CRP-like cAMP-binding protein